MKYLLLSILIFGLLITTVQAQASTYQSPQQEYEEAVRLHPDSAEAWYKLGEFNRKIYSRQAKTAFNKAIELKPDYAEAYNSLGLWHQTPSECGNTYLEWDKETWEKQYGKAIELHQKAVQLKPDFAEAYVALGNAYSRLNRHEEAANAYKQAVKLNSTDTVMYQLLAATYEKLQRYDAAIDFYQMTIRYSRNYQRETNERESSKKQVSLYMAYHGLADLYRKSGRFQEAREAYRQIIQLKIDGADTHYHLGLTYLDLADKKAAQDEYDILKKLSETERLDEIRRIIEKQAKDLLEQINKQ
jgi:tetratricopeptide (TPR) repeat protein